MKNQMLIYIFVAVIIAGGVGFFGGMKYADIQTQRNRQQFFNSFQDNGNDRFNRQGRNGTRNLMGRNGLRPINGEIIKTDDKSVTLKLTDGSSKIIMLTDKTVFNKTEAVSKSDLKTGSTIGVFGTENQDGSVTAVNVQINPLFRTRPTDIPVQ